MVKTMVMLLALAATGAQAAQVYRLQRQWVDQVGHRFCEYSDGTILNVKFNTCPLTIKA